MKKKKDFVSNVTGEEWFKHNSIIWKKVINQVGVVKEDEIHQGKYDQPVTLKKGSRVIIDDIRGRIKPQYRVIDESGKIWFVSALNLDILEDKNRKADASQHKYKGGVRQDNSEAAPYRYAVSKTTEEEIKDK